MIVDRITDPGNLINIVGCEVYIKRVTEVFFFNLVLNFIYATNQFNATIINFAKREI